MSDRFRGGQPIYPKPFEYLDLPDGRPRRSNPRTHEKADAKLVSGQLSGRIRTLGPIHIGSGYLELSRRLPLSSKDQQKNPLVRGFVRSGGQCVIPGSSLKGAVRSVVEAVTLSCVAKKGSRTYLPNQDFMECRNKEYLCPACRLFGAMGFLGKVKFRDAVQLPDSYGKRRVEVHTLPQMFRPQTNDPDGRKFYMHGKQASGDQPVEVVPEGEFFSFGIRFDNLEEAEMGVILLALGLSPRPAESLRLKVGGFKPACYGSVEFEPERLLVEQSFQNCLDYDAVQDELITDSNLLQKRFEGWVSVARDGNNPLVLRDQFTELANTLKYPGERDCPPGLY